MVIHTVYIIFMIFLLPSSVSHFHLANSFSKILIQSEVFLLVKPSSILHFFFFLFKEKLYPR